MGDCTQVPKQTSIRDRIDEIQGIVRDGLTTMEQFENKVGVGKDCKPEKEAVDPFSTLEKLNHLHASTLELRARLNDLNGEF